MKKLGFGLMRLPLTDAGEPTSIDIELVKHMADRYLAEGFTYFDTAYPYHQGTSETAFREAVVKRYPREAYQVADKMPTWAIRSPEDYPKYFVEQLERCGVEYFDYYLLHNLGQISYASTEQHGGFAFLQKLKAEGKAKRIGFSFHDSVALLDRILTEHPETEFVQLQINYIDWENEGIESRKCYETAAKHGKPVIVMEPVKGGSLAAPPEEARRLFAAHSPDRSAASWAIRYAASLPEVMVVLSGMSDLAQLEDNMGSMREFAALSEDERAVIDQAAAIIRASVAVPCTACRYCTDECPKQIAIPEYFSLLNERHRYGLRTLYEAYYTNLTQVKGKASDCIGCKQCERHCPQHIAIVDRLKDVAAAFEKPETK